MRRRIVFLAAWLVALALAGFASAQDEMTVSGRVVDEQGRAAAGVTLSSSWDFKNSGGPTASEGATSVTSDENGSFEGTIRIGRRPVALYALDAAGTRGGLAVVDREKAADPITITLAPVTRVRGTIVSKELGGPPGQTYVGVGASTPGGHGGGANLGGCSSDDGPFTLLLPPGAYKLFAFADDLRFHEQEIDVVAGKTEIDLGAIDVAPTIIAKHYGKAPPGWTVSEARGTAPDVKLIDYKGKWVLLEFWGYW